MFIYLLIQSLMADYKISTNTEETYEGRCETDTKKKHKTKQNYVMQLNQMDKQS